MKKKSALLMIAFSLAILAAMTTSLRANEVELYAPVVQFEHDNGGKIHIIVRYDLGAPNRVDTGWLILGSPERNGELPSVIPVVDANGHALAVVNSQGPDCVLQRVTLYHEAEAYLLVIASRHWEGAKLPVQSELAPMDIQLYRLQTNPQAIGAPTLFRPENAPTRTEPACAAYDIDQAIAATVARWRKQHAT